jgi:8-oxo-dGTP pyrophosphatase MutT (NUDIX family)
MTLYTDVDGGRIERPPDVAPIWRTSCYAIVRRDRSILMTKPLDAVRWELPGGGIEPGTDTSLIGAAIRECFEETGHTLVPDPGTLRFGGEVLLHARRSGIFVNLLPFYVQGAVNDVPDPAWLEQPEEDVEVAWIDPATLTIASAYWFHLDGLKMTGVLA